MVLLIQQTSVRVANTDLIGHPNVFQWALMISTITAGTMLLMWIGEIITEKGIGNGISLIIFCGIISRLPTSAGQIGSLASGDTAKILQLVLFLVATLGIIAFVVPTQRRHPQYPCILCKTHPRQPGVCRRRYPLAITRNYRRRYSRSSLRSPS